jgi:predicted alpha/beta superfamily hydrolase
MSAQRLALKRAGLTAFLLTPVLILAFLMWFWAGQWSMVEQRSSPPTPAPPSDKPRAVAGTPDANGEPLPDQPAVAPELVAPETLEQGFIVVAKDSQDLASASAPIFIASSFNGWNPRDMGWVMSARSDMRWQMVFDKPERPGRMEFKLTRGSWATVETTSAFENIANRMLPLLDASSFDPGERPVIEIEVAGWRDQRPDEATAPVDPLAPIDATGTVRRLQVAGGAGDASGMTRDLLVWLPAGYDDEPGHAYPVVYLHDGQNLFAGHPGIPGEWGADETATRLIASGEVGPFIIVGVPNGGAARIGEYSVIPFREGWPAHGRAHAEWFIREVVPRVERAFRVDPSRAFVGGSSLGAVVSLQIGVDSPDRFAGLLIESPSMLVDRDDFWEVLRRVERWPGRVYIGMGGQEAGPTKPELNARYAQAARDLSEMLVDLGVQSMTLIPDEHRHDEHAWRERLPEALLYLLSD